MELIKTEYTKDKTADHNTVLGVMVKWYNDSNHPEIVKNSSKAMRFLHFRLDLFTRFYAVRVYVNKDKIDELLGRMGAHLHNERIKR